MAAVSGAAARGRARYEDARGSVQAVTGTARLRGEAVTLRLAELMQQPQDGAGGDLPDRCGGVREGVTSWRVVSVREVEDAIVEIAAIHRSGKYRRIDATEHFPRRHLSAVRRSVAATTAAALRSPAFERLGGCTARRVLPGSPMPVRGSRMASTATGSGGTQQMRVAATGRPS